MKKSRIPSYLQWRVLLLVTILWSLVLRQADAYQFKLGDVTMDLQEITTNVDVYFSAMRFNRAANEWDVDVTVSNKVTQTFSGPLVLLVDSFSGTSGPLRPDGSSTNQFFYDFSGQLNSGLLSAGVKSAIRTIALGFTANASPQMKTRAFAAQVAGASNALAFARSLNQVGQPLPAVSVLEQGPSGSVTNVTDSAFGVVTLGRAPGPYTWKFTRDGYLPVWRQATLQTSQVALVSSVWLTPRDVAVFPLSPLAGGVVSNQAAIVQFSPGSLSQNTQAQLTSLDSQTLPALLPPGWSPLQALWLELGAEPSHAPIATVTPWGPIASTESAVLVRLDPGTLTWQVLQLVPGAGSNSVSVLLPGSGAYVLAVADAAPLTPPPPAVGQPLPAFAALTPNPENLRAAGVVIPASSPASTVPEMVTAQADVSVTNLTAGLSSGTQLRGQVTESYLLSDTTHLTPPLFDDSLLGYQRPGDLGAGTLHARFPLRPLLLFGPQQLNQAVVHMDLFARGTFTGGVFDTNGGLVASEPVRVLAAPGTFQTLQAIELRSLNPSNFTDLAGTNFPVVAAFEVGVGALGSGQALSVQATDLPTNASFVLARVLLQTDAFGLEPRQRLQSDANGNLTSAESPTRDRLPGLTGSGEYVLLQVQPEQDLVEGVAKNASGQSTGGLPVRVAGQPWLTFSAPDGSFKLLAPAGDGSLTVADLATGDTGTQALTVPTNLVPVNTSVASLAGGLQVVSITPSNGAGGVPLVSSVSIDFSRPLNPATLVSNAVQLLGASNQSVAATFSLNLANTTLSLLPSGGLDPATQFTVLLGTNITDGIGRALQGQTQFVFTTVALSARDPAAQLIIYAPGATNLTTNVVVDLPGFVAGTNASLVVVHGTPGCADPAVPVVIVNEGSGQTTTVLSKSDGSFTSFVVGQEQDFISATFISLNGSRVYVPVNRQLFDDGSVGLYQQGGALLASGDGGPVQVTVPPNALQGRAKFLLKSVTVPQLQTQLGGIMPSNGVVAGSALNLGIQGAAPTLPLQVSFPVDLTAVGYPTNELPTNAAAALTVVTTNQEVTAFQVVAQATFQPNASSPLLRAKNGHVPKGPGDQQAATGALNAVFQFTVPGFQAQFLFNTFVVPLIFGPRPVTIKGVVGYVPADIVAQVQAIHSAAGTVTAGGIIISFGGPIGAAFGQGIIGTSAVADAALTAAELKAALPLSGAFITLNLSGGPINADAGRLSPGMVYATSGSDGSFLMVAPQAGANYLITATDPIYQRLLEIPVNPVSFNPLFNKTELSLAGVVFKNFFFSVPQASLIPPHVNLSTEPTQPAAGQPCTVQVTAYQPSGPPAVGVKVKNVGNKDLLTGQPLTNPQAPITSFNRATNGNTVTWTGTIIASDAVAVTLEIVVQAQNAAQDSILPYELDFTGNTPPVPTTIPPPSSSDVHGPLVIEANPPDNGFIGENSLLTVIFNKPIDASVTNHLAGISLSGPGTPLTPIVTLSPDQQVLQLEFPGLQAGAAYKLTLSGQSIQDLGGQALNQVPSSSTAVSFITNFRTPPSSPAPLPQLVNGRGAVISGNQLYALDQAPQGNYLKAYDITLPSKPKFEGQLLLPGAARDLVVIPQFRYVTNAVNINAIQTNDLVAVVGGDLDSELTTNAFQGPNITVAGQYLWVVNMGNPASPQVLASPIVSFRVSSAVTKVRWAPPYLVYQEYGADIQLLGFVNLQEMLIGFGSIPSQISQFPQNGQDGATTNFDGSYVDPGETLPIPPQRPLEFFGKHQSYVLQATTQPILDFSVANGGSLVGITLRNGKQLDAHNLPTGPNLPPAYRTLVSGRALNLAVPTDATYPFATTAYPRWVSLFSNFSVLVNGVPTTFTAALVSLAPDSDNVEKLAVLDITLPESPRLVNTIPIPSSLLGGDMQSVSMRADGLLELAGTKNLVVLDPSKMAVLNVPAGQLPPSIVDVVPGAGAVTRSLGSSSFGVHAVADSGRAQVVQSPPLLRFVSFPQSGALVDPAGLAGQGDAAVNQVLTGLRSTGALSPARVKAAPSLNIPSDLAPPNPALHYYVLMAAPGGSGASIDLGLESLNLAGWPISNLGNGFAPVRAVSLSTQTATGQMPRPGCGATIRSLTAYRLSNNPLSPYYNFYLSRPFALIVEGVSTTELSTLQGNGGVDRELLFGRNWLRAFIDPQQSTNLAIGQFAAQIDSGRQLIYPISVASAATVDCDFIPGDNPPPPGGATMMPGTYASICAHSSELRTEVTDLVLPSPRMPIEIKRAIGDQDTYEGPFGVGWDFNYNQRLTELAPLTFPAGLQLPLIARDNAADSEIANSKDVLFHTGMGQLFIFRWISQTMPTEYTQDPLVQQANYQNLASDYYVPAPGQGVFDLLVKLKDGRFERLTPRGELYRYTPQGRLEAIYDRFPANYHWLQYDSHGWLTRIDDNSVTAPRYVQFGYYRHQNSLGQIADPDYNASLDLLTANPYLEGKICRLLDYTGRDILYQYTDDGFLTNRLGIQVAGENGGYAGRSHIIYNYAACRLVGVAASVNGTPLLSAVTVTGPDGKPMTQSTAGVGGPVQLTVPLQNNAASLAGQVTSAAMADGSKTQFTFDKWGNPASTTISGPRGADSTIKTSSSQEGLLALVTYPEGNTKTLTYDTNNPVFRSRANLVQVKVDPRTRGGTAYTETFQYDPRYNLQSGGQQDGNGFTHTYKLTSDGRSVISVTHGAAGTETAAYNNNGQLTNSTNIRGVSRAMVYDSSTGFLLSRQLGTNTYTYAYGSDVSSQLGRPSSVTLPAGAPYKMTYNAVLQPVELQRADLTEDFGYDEQGYVMYHSQRLGGGKTLVAHPMYDVKGFLLTNVLDGVEVNGQPTSLEYDFIPDPVWRIQSIRYPQGTLETYQYDGRGNVTKKTTGNYVEEYTLDLNNNVTQVKEGGDVVKTTVYDGFDRPITVTRKTGTQDETETRTYYAEGQLNSRSVADPQFGVSDQRTYDQIDELGRRLHEIIGGLQPSPTYTYSYAPGSHTIIGPRMTTTQTWNNAGYPTKFTDPVLTTVYHPNGNGLNTQVDHLEDGATYNDYYTYDSLDHRLSEADNVGTVFSYLPRNDGGLLAQTNALGHATTYDLSVLAETVHAQRQDGLTFQHWHDPDRKPSFDGDPSGGSSKTYDGDFRLTTSTLRNGAPTVYGSFDARNMPQSISLPAGGSGTMAYDLQRRLTDQSITYQSTTYQVHNSYDAVDRLRVVTYQQDNGVANKTTYNYDQAGPLLSVRFQEDLGDFTLHYRYYPDASRQSVTYPSGVLVSEQRDPSGRLTGVSDTNGNIIQVVSWMGDKEPALVQLGTSMQVTNTYDARGRLTGRRVTRLGDGAVLVHLRYQYDGANNQQIRQFVHRNGKADSFFYDTGERLRLAQVGTVPISASTFAAPLYDRTYNYHQSGLDYLTSTSTTNLSPDIPAFATNWSAHDPFLLPTSVDGSNRIADPMGNVALASLQARPVAGVSTEPVSATLLHNGNGKLVRIARADGLVEENFYQPNGLRYERRLSQQGQVVDYRHFVYDIGSRLIEEYEQTNGTVQLLARYYYATADAPEAADLFNPATATLQRYYLLKDNMQSVVAVADTNGVVVERAWYDPFGQPAIEQRDYLAPKLQTIIDGGANSLLLAFSESVWTPADDPGPGGGIVSFPPPPVNPVTVSVLSSNIPGTFEWLPSVPGFAPYSVGKFTPGQALPSVPPAGFLAWWPADGTTQDVQGGHNATLQGGATYGPGLIGQSFLLNGTSAFVQVPDAPALNFGTNDFTASLWVNFKNTAGQQVLFEKWVASPPSGWSLIKLSNNRLRLALSDGAGGELDVDSGVLALPPTNWVHYAVRRQNNQFAIFTNGVAVAVQTNSVNVNAATSLLFGSRAGTNSFLNGSMDELTLYDRALSAAELTAVAGGISVPGPVNLTLNAGTLVDEWGNTNEAQTVSFQVYNQTGLVYYTDEPLSPTAAPPLARSSVGSPFLFHGQYFDYDTGLIDLRARFYDPYSGMFFEPDPLGYEDSVNLYAGMRNNPVGFRDPTGLGGWDILRALGRFFSRSEQAAAKGGETLSKVSEDAPIVGKAGEELGVAGERTEGLGQAGEIPPNQALGDLTANANLQAEYGSMSKAQRAAQDLKRMVTDFAGKPIEYKTGDLVYGRYKSIGYHIVNEDAIKRVGQGVVRDMDTEFASVEGTAEALERPEYYKNGVGNVVEVSEWAMDRALKRGSTVHFDITQFGEVEQASRGAGQYASTITAQELQYLRRNWDLIKNQALENGGGSVRFYEFGKEVRAPWEQ